MVKPTVSSDEIKPPHVLRAQPISVEAMARQLLERAEEVSEKMPPGAKAAGRPVVLGVLAALMVGFVIDVGPWNAIASRLLGTADAQEATTGALADGSIPSEADRAALRYFAREGDVERLEAELRRLRALYPSWSPPRDLLDTQGEDTELQRVYDLVGEQRYDEAREAIAERQQRDPTYEPPARLVALLELAEVRQSLRDASEANNHTEVLRIAETNEGILTCGDVDSLWRVAEAFARTGRPQRAFDAYAYVINTCEDEAAQAGSIQKAAEILEPPLVINLFELKETEVGTGEFGEAQLGIIRAAVAASGDAQRFAVPQMYLDLLAEYARTGTNLEDAMLVGYYLYRTGFPTEAAQWFRFALDNGLGADAAEGYIIALRATGSREDEFLAREVAFEWREQTPELMEIYLDALATMLTADEFGNISIEDVEQTSVDRFVPVVIEQRDANGAQALGWYAFNTCQFIIAEEWFISSANWVPTEAAIYGLALTRLRLGDQAGFDEIVDEWAPLYRSVQGLRLGDDLDPADPVTGAVDDTTDEVGVDSVICDPDERRRLQELIAEEEGNLGFTEAGSLSAGVPVRPLATRPDGAVRPAIPRRSVVIRPDAAEGPKSLLTQIQAVERPLPTPARPRIVPQQNLGGAPTLPQAGRVIAPPPITSADEAQGRESIIRQRALQNEPRFQDTRSQTFTRRRRLQLEDGRAVRPVERRTTVVTGGNRAVPRGGSTVERRVRRGRPITSPRGVDSEVEAIVSRPRSSSAGRVSGGGTEGGSAAQRALSQRNFSRCISVTDRAIQGGNLSAADANARGFCLLELRRPVEAAQAFQLARLAARRNASQRNDAVYGSTLAAIALNMTNVAAVEATKAPLSRARRTEVQIDILTQRAIAANRDGRYTEALYYLDQRSRIAPLQKDLMLLQGYAYLNAGDFRSARRIFRAVNASGGNGESAAALFVLDQRFAPPLFRQRTGD